MIDRVRLVNFKSHADTTVDIGPLTVLVGANASGKTSVLQALHTLCGRATRRGHNLFDVFPESLMSQRCRAGTTMFRISMTRILPNGPQVEAILGGERSDIKARWKGVEEVRVNDNRRPWQEADASIFGGAALLKLDPQRIARPSAAKTTTRIAADGSDLATVWAHLKISDDSAVAAILSDLQKVVPAVRAIRAIPTDIGQETTGYQLTLDFEGAASVPASEASEGTLIALALLSVLHGQDCPSLVLLDDLESGIHPLAQQEVVGLLKRVSETRPQIQIVATSHSPYILSALDPKYVYVTAIKNGISHVKPLTQHPLAAKRLQVLDAGEFWSSEDESWVLAP